VHPIDSVRFNEETHVAKWVNSQVIFCLAYFHDFMSSLQPFHHSRAGDAPTENQCLGVVGESKGEQENAVNTASWISSVASCRFFALSSGFVSRLPRF
jgi:hypothetical protein